VFLWDTLIVNIKIDVDINKKNRKTGDSFFSLIIIIKIDFFYYNIYYYYNKTIVMNKIDKIRREIAFLRKAKLNNEITEHHKITKCPCCYTKLTTKNTVNMLHCEHALCKKCHIHWFDDQHKNTCPLCRKKNYKSLELSNGLSTIINEKVNQLDDLETDISNYNTILEDKRDEVFFKPV